MCKNRCRLREQNKQSDACAWFGHCGGCRVLGILNAGEETDKFDYSASAPLGCLFFKGSWDEPALKLLGDFKRIKNKSRKEHTMDIIKKQEGTTLTVALTERLDTVTSPQLEGKLRTAVNGVTELFFDLAGLEYISSAGLRVLLSTQKVMNKQGKMTIRNVKPEIMEIFEVTGFADILNIEE